MLYLLFLIALSSQSYLNTFAFGNTVYTDLWDHLQQVGTVQKILQSQMCCDLTRQCVLGCVCVFLKFLLLSVCCQAVENTPGMHIPQTIHNIMNRWTLQMGFPVVTIDTRTGSITQKHFLLDPDSIVDRPSQFK